MDDKSQVSTEYLLLVAMAIAITLVAVSIAMELRNLTDSVTARVRTERGAALSMLSH